MRPGATFLCQYEAVEKTLSTQAKQTVKFSIWTTKITKSESNMSTNALSVIYIE